MKSMPETFWTERSVPGSPSWPFFRGRALSRYHFAFPYARGKRVIDVACGTGHGSHLLASPEGGGAAEVVGVDISAEAVAYAREHYAAPNVSYFHADGSRLPELGLEGFDLVTSMGTLEHVESPDGFAQAVHHVLKPGGVWLVTMLNPERHDSVDEFHHQEWDLASFRSFLERHFSSSEIRWLVLLPSGMQKMARTAERYRYVPGWIKAAAKRLLGRGPAYKLSNVRAQFCEPEDYVWAETPHSDSIEFLGIALK